LHTPRRDLFFIVKKVVLYSFVAESIGTVILFWRFAQDFASLTAFYHALYHAVSAFNNAGFSLFKNNLVSYQGDMVVNIVIMTLIVLGGIGFIVQNELLGRWGGSERRFSVHAKIVLTTTLFLIIVGAASFYFLEKNNILKEANIKVALLVSFFQSVTARTAGFNTVDIGMLTNSSILILILLMFIGASPGSTGGGIKTTSFSLLLLLIFNRLKGSENVNVANRTIPKETIEKTISIVLAAVFFICLVTSILLFFGETSTAPSASRHQFVEYLFETVSAFGTVGLSMGITNTLNDPQKAAIIFMMFAGRVGPLTLAFALYSARKKGITYAEETVMVG